MQLNGNENHIIIAKCLQKNNEYLLYYDYVSIRIQTICDEQNITIDIDIMKY